MTVRPPLSSLSGSTGLGSSAPSRCAQLLQLSGNGGWRQGSAHFPAKPASSPAIRSRCSCSPLLLSAAPVSCTFLGSPLATKVGFCLACFARSSHVRCRSPHHIPYVHHHTKALPTYTNFMEPPAKPLSPPLAPVVGEGPCLTSLRPASLPLGPVGLVTSW